MITRILYTAEASVEGGRADRAEAVELMTRAHEICPYSRATRGNIEVRLAVAGTAIEAAAA